MAKIILKCVKESGKLRIKFHSFIDDEEKEYRNVYNNTYNCQFPKDIRAVGRFFEIADGDLNTVITRGKPFYRVNKKNIKILDNYNDTDIDITKVKVFDLDECVICLDEKPTTIFLPCGHQTCCTSCYHEVYTEGYQTCPICRRDITDKYFINE